MWVWDASVAEVGWEVQGDGDTGRNKGESGFSSTSNVC